jgi:hypothetical protein
VFVMRTAVPGVTRNSELLVDSACTSMGSKDFSELTANTEPFPDHIYKLY